MKEEEISPIINNLLTTAHINRSIKEDLFQDLYLYHLQLEKRYIPEMNVPLVAFLIKFLKWRMWALIKTTYSDSIQVPENIPDHREEENLEDITILIEGLGNISDENKTLLIFRHSLDKSYKELAKFTGLSIEGVRKKLSKIERRIKWEGINKKTVKREE